MRHNLLVPMLFVLSVTVQLRPGCLNYARMQVRWRWAFRV